MEHFFRNIQGWCCYVDLYKRMVEGAKNGARFVEIGSWLGRSASFMSVEIINSGKQIEFFCVDPWDDGGPDLKHRVVKMKRSLYDQFLENTSPVKDFLKPIRLKAHEASQQFTPESLDFVMIDGSHQYEDVRQDIMDWLPKVKPGGVISGDDYNWKGVAQAVRELLPQSKITVLEHRPAGKSRAKYWEWRKPC